MDTVGQPTQEAPLSEAEQHSSQVFVDASGRRARRLTRCGYLLGLGCVGYIGMVALGLSGTRVAALPGVPTSAENEIIAGLSGEGGSIGLHLTRVPVAAPARPTPTRAVETHAATVRSTAAHSATESARVALARSRFSANAPGTVTGRPAQQGVQGTQGMQARGYEQVLAEGGNTYPAADPADPTETKSQEKAEEKAAQKADAKTEKSDSKRSKHGSDDESY